MEKAISINPTEDTPKVVLNKEKEKFEISGRSLPEDAEKFYFPLLLWIKNYVQDPAEKTIFKIKLEYFNSSSVKQLLKLLTQLEQIEKKDKEVKVLWYYDAEDELMEQKGLELKSIIEVPFEVIPGPETV